MSIINRRTNSYRGRGFSLVEILVVLGLFSSISTLSLGALFNAKSINSHLQETQSVLDNLNLSVQTITREIRFGSDFNCISTTQPPEYIATVRNNCVYGADGGTPGAVLGFKPSDAVNDNDRVAFYVDNDALYKRVFPQVGDVQTYQMTPNDIDIRSVMFYVDGAGTIATDNKQPLVVMFISGVTRPSSITVPPVELNLEIAMSAREPDNR